MIESALVELNGCRLFVLVVVVCVVEDALFELDACVTGSEFLVVVVDAVVDVARSDCNTIPTVGIGTALARWVLTKISLVANCCCCCWLFKLAFIDAVVSGNEVVVVAVVEGVKVCLIEVVNELKAPRDEASVLVVELVWLLEVVALSECCCSCPLSKLVLINVCDLCVLVIFRLLNCCLLTRPIMGSSSRFAISICLDLTSLGPLVFKLTLNRFFI